ncbi:MAG TPA: 2-dehydropantoate 2-reductase [Polyangiaceae bacterium]|nr:2-dehydropantoate 2-reductase [Polyangiaceae bacterium]
MRIGIVGAGGVGGLIAGLLARAGHGVGLVARGRTREAIEEKGLRVDSPLGVFTARVDVGSPEELAPVDAVLLAVKTWQVPEVAATLGPMLRRDTVVATLQNGVDAPDQCVEVLGPERVFGGICHVLSWIVEPGSIKHVAAAPRVTLGPWRTPIDGRIHALKQALESAGVPVRIPEDFPAALWDKFLFIASFGGVGAVTRAGAGALRTIPQTRQLLVGAFEEVQTLANAKQVALRPDSVAKALALVDVLPEDSIASLQRDVVAGRPSEVDSLSGAAARIGTELGVSVPIHAAIYAALLPQERAARAAARG